MRIEDETKLDYSEVLIRPKRSTLGSRKEVRMERTFTFAHDQNYEGIPIMASNMDGVFGGSHLGRSNHRSNLDSPSINCRKEFLHDTKQVDATAHDWPQIQMMDFLLE